MTESSIEIFQGSNDNDAKLLLDYIILLSSKNKKRRFLEYSVKSYNTDKLVLGEKAKTWIRLSNVWESRLSYFLEDEEGIFELEHFEISIEGLAECLRCLFYQQTEVNKQTFDKKIKQLVHNIR